MPTWKSRGLRGSALEDMINYTIEQYSTKKLALIQKIPTPIKPINIDQETRHITLAYLIIQKYSRLYWCSSGHSNLL